MTVLTSPLKKKWSNISVFTALPLPALTAFFFPLNHWPFVIHFWEYCKSFKLREIGEWYPDRAKGKTQNGLWQLHSCRCLQVPIINREKTGTVYTVASVLYQTWKWNHTVLYYVSQQRLWDGCKCMLVTFNESLTNKSKTKGNLNVSKHCLVIRRSTNRKDKAQNWWTKQGQTR